jgi:protein-disulfide isomerase
VTRWLCAAALLVAAAGCAPRDAAPPGEAPASPVAPVAQDEVEIDNAAIASRIQSYFAKSISPDIELEARDIAPSNVPGWLTGTLVVNAGGDGQQIGFLVTPDGHYFISGEVTDLTIDPLEALLEKIDLTESPGRGPADATVTIVEYSDFQCPFCARGYQIVEEQVLPEYEGKVRFYFKHLPLKSIHPWAEAAALAAECAREQSAEGYWALYHALFKHQQDLNEDNLHEKVTGFAKDAGLDEEKFAECIDSEKALARIERDIDEAAAIGANSTPTFFINGRRLEGAQPLDSFKAVIDAELG